MTIQELDQKLNSPGFQEIDNDLFYNFYIYLYPVEQEYDIRRQIHEFKENLSRPVNYQDVLTLNLFSEFCYFLDHKPFLGNPSMLRYLLEKEKSDPSTANQIQNTLTRNAHSPAFMKHIEERINSHISAATADGRPHAYVFLYGIGSMFPYLRVNEFLAEYEDYNSTNAYKIIVFYPGKRDGNSFRLFETLHDNHTYRAVLLLNGDE